MGPKVGHTAAGKPRTHRQVPHGKLVVSQGNDLILVANSLGCLHKRLRCKCRKGGSSCGGPKYILQPCRDAH
jgi:hypothetical protein